jgi:glc operon protein GlcG
MAGSSAAASPLVVRSQVRIGLAGARVIISAAEAMAIKMDLKLNLAVVDDGGHLVAFERMDGARLASLYVAITQATWAATFRQATGPLAAGATPADPLLNLSLQNAAQASGAKLTVVDVGVPILIDGQTIGAIGVSGGTGEQDAQVARAGIQALVDQLTAMPKAENEVKSK